MVEVSVIVPAYNAARSLPRTLASVCNQTLRDIEIIVVDDASQDDTHKVALSIACADSRVRVIRRTTNGGPAPARNSGVEAAKGRWIALLDADDLYLPQRLAVLTDAARSAECEAVADNIMLRCPETGRCLGVAIPPHVVNSPRLLTASEFARNDRPFPGGFGQFGYLKPLIRRAFLEQHKIRYDADLWVAEDFVFYMRCMLAGSRMLLLPDAYYQYVLSRDSITRSDAHVARNYELLSLGNARILAQAQQRRNRATLAQIKRRRRNIAFLRSYRAYKGAAQRRRWGEAVAHLIRMPLAPVELTWLVRLYLERRLSRAGVGLAPSRSLSPDRQPTVP
jgi:glycosyltransferase involved in cell wall biosynthesis